MAYKDPLDERARASRRKHYHANKEQYYRRNKEKEQSLKHFIDAVKSYPCTDCGESYPPYVMDFDHLPDYEKVTEIAKVYKSGSWSKTVMEIMKCELVCSNCHRIRTYSRKDEANE
jgi:hypothetical protein